MASNAAKDVRFAFKVQSGLGTLASGAGATGVLVRPSQGMQRSIALAQSQIIAADGMGRKPRHGSVSVPASYETELILDALDDVFQAAGRGTWATALAHSNSEFTSCAISGGGATVTMGGGSLITQGYRRGMLVKLTNMSTGANNDVWFPILALTATVITTRAGILTDQSADATFNIASSRYLLQGDPPVERYYTTEQYLQGIDTSLVGQDLKFGGFRFSAEPNQPVQISWDMMGRDLDLLATGSSPTFSSPTFATGRPLYLADGAMYINGAAVVNITGFSFQIALSPSTVPVIGSRLSPDVFLENSVLTGQISGTIEDDTYLNYAINETQLSILLHCAEREANPADFVAFYLGDCAVGDFGLPFGGAGALIQSFPIIGGKDEGGATNGFAPTQVLVCTSAA